jgi:hypothetical protein
MMSVLALSLYACLRISFRARDSANAAVAPARSMQIAMELLRQDLESALPPTGTLASTFMGTFGPMVPSTSAIEFHAVTSPPAGPMAKFVDTADPTNAPGVHRIQLFVQQLPGDTSMALVRRTTRNLLSPVEAPYEDEILCRGVRAFQIRYFDGLNWLDIWDSTQLENALPMIIEVALELDVPQTRPGETSPTPPTQRMTRLLFPACYTQGGAV